MTVARLPGITLIFLILFTLPLPHAEARVDIDAQLAKLAPWTLEFDKSKLRKDEKQILKMMVDVGWVIDQIFLNQVKQGNRRIFQDLLEKYYQEPNKRNRQRLEYYWSCRGPYDCIGDNLPFVQGVGKISLGRNFYPYRIPSKEVELWEKRHPKDTAAFQNDRTVIRRDGKRKLRAIPYSEYWQDELEYLHKRLRKVAAISKSPALKKFLIARARSFMTNDYRGSEKRWLNVNSANDRSDGNLEIVIGPYEHYEDELLKRKASFELFVGVKNSKQTAQMQKYKPHVHKIDDYLYELVSKYASNGTNVAPDKVIPQRKVTRWTPPGKKVTLLAMDVAYMAGDAAKGIQTLAFNLPNDSYVREHVGTKKILLMNMLEGKFTRILKPLSSRMIAESQVKQVTSEMFIEHTLHHELAHGVGPATVNRDGKKIDVGSLLGKYAAAVEEAKAEVVGMLLAYYLIDLGVIPASAEEKLNTTYVASTFRTVRFGVHADHAKGKVFEFNRLMQNGAITVQNGRYVVQHSVFRGGIEKLAVELIDLQLRGAREEVASLYEQHGKLDQKVLAKLAGMKKIPVDLRVKYTFGKNYAVLN